MSTQPLHGESSATQRRFGEDVRQPAPAFAPVFGARPPGILVRLAKLLAGKGRAATTPGAETAAGVPDPGKLFPAPRYGADGAALESGQGAHYDLIASELRQEAGELDVAGADKATTLGHALARSLVDQMEASAIYNMASVLRGVIMLAVVGFAAGLTWRIAAQLDPAPFSYAALYAFIGLFGVIAAGLAADGAGGEAKKRFARSSGDLESLVALATGRFRDRLIDQRAAMQPNAAADLPGAISAAARARLTTVAALRFYDRTPVIGAEGEGYRCEVLGAAVRAAAQHRLGAGARFIGRFSALIFGAALGIVALYFSLAQPVGLIAPPAFLADLIAAEAARPGIVSFALVIAAAIFAPHLFGPFAAQLIAADDPAAALKRYGLDAAANGLKNRALTAAAEGPREMIERFADALLALERRAEAWSNTDARFADNPGALEPSWRKAPEAPRFVAQSFAATPASFVAGPRPAAQRGFFSKESRPDANPKQALGTPESPPWLKN